MEYIVHQSWWEWGTQVTIISNDGLAFLRFHIEKSAPTLAHFTIVQVHPSVRKEGRMKSIWFQAEKVAKELGCTTIQGYSDPNLFIHQWYLKNGMHLDEHYLKLDQYDLLSKEI